MIHTDERLLEQADGLARWPGARSPWRPWSRPGAPRRGPAGSLLIVDGKGEMEGSVSGGCIEGAVIREALACMEGAPPKLLEFGVSNEQAWDVGLACGGRVQVYVEAVE